MRLFALSALIGLAFAADTVVRELLTADANAEVSVMAAAEKTQQKTSNVEEKRQNEIEKWEHFKFAQGGLRTEKERDEFLQKKRAKWASLSDQEKKNIIERRKALFKLHQTKIKKQKRHEKEQQKEQIKKEKKDSKKELKTQQDTKQKNIDKKDQQKPGQVVIKKLEEVKAQHQQQPVEKETGDSSVTTN